MRSMECESLAREETDEPDGDRGRGGGDRGGGETTASFARDFAH